MYQVTSEVYEESQQETHHPLSDGRVLSTFRYHNPLEDDAEKVCLTHANSVAHDKDGDLVVTRKRPKYNEKLLIEHQAATELRLVGLQVWRGALLLADYLFHCRQELRQHKIFELGAGVGLTSIAAASIGLNMVCTDVDLADILQTIRANIKHNQRLMRGTVQVMEYDFKQPTQQYSAQLLNAIDNCDVVLAADVIYDDVLTDAFLQVLEFIFAREQLTKRSKRVLVALEKRFVFTLSDLETTPPMFDYFLRKLTQTSWKLKYIPTDFPQFFEYKRCEQLVLFELTSGQCLF